jgi:hypothetical protein
MYIFSSDLLDSEPEIESGFEPKPEEPEPEPVQEIEPEVKPGKRVAKGLKPKPVPDITETLPHAFRKSRKLTPKEITYVREIFGDSLNYDKVRVTRDHWFALGSTRVVGNTINFTSSRGGEFLFEDTPEWQLNKVGLDLLGHEIGHVWQYQNGGWAYAGDSLAKQAAGAYSTGSRNTAYDWKEAHYWEIPWTKWGPEQQAQAIDDWNMALRYDRENKKDLIEKLQPFVDKARQGIGPPRFSVPGAVVTSLVFGSLGCGIAHLLQADKKTYSGAGVALGLLVSLPWNKWYLKKPKLDPIPMLEVKMAPKVEEAESDVIEA